MIGADSELFLSQHFKMQKGTPGAFAEEAMKEYVRCFCTSESIHASCEDYRAAADVDLETDEADEKAGRKVDCPVLALWGAKGAIGKLWDVIDVWKQRVNSSVEGSALTADTISRRNSLMK